MAMTNGIPWPEDLVDIAAIRATPPPDDVRQGPFRSALLSSAEGGAIPFHKPSRFRAESLDGHGTQSGNGRRESEGASDEAQAGANEVDRGRPTRPSIVPISSFYMSQSHPPSAFDNWRGSSTQVNAGSNGRRSLRRKVAAPAFNIMVVGARGTGKTSFLRLLLESADPSPSATDEQRASIRKFLSGAPSRTEAMESATMEITESRVDRLLLSVIDTPGLDFGEGRELRAERQMNAIMRYLDAQYADTMNEESKLVRQNKGDQHVHLCVFMMDPSSVVSPSSRRMRHSLPAKKRPDTAVSQTRSRTSEDVNIEASHMHGEGMNGEAEEKGESGTRISTADNPMENEANDELEMSPSELRVISRLAARVNVLPVIARADTLTDEVLVDVKSAVRRGLAGAGLDFGVFGMAAGMPSTATKEEPTSPVNKVNRNVTNGNGNEAENGRANGHADSPVLSTSSANGISPQSLPASAQDSPSANPGPEAETADADETSRPTRPVIKLRAPRRKLSRSRSRSRRDLASVAAEELGEPVAVPARRTSSSIPPTTNGGSNDISGPNSAIEVSDEDEYVAQVRFSASQVAPKLSERLPFALIAPEERAETRARTRALERLNSSAARPGSANGVNGAVNGCASGSVISNGDASMVTSPTTEPNTPGAPAGRRASLLPSAPPEPLRGLFTRRFRWGAVDVLDPTHCDFSALRTAVLTTHMKALKTHTREVLYEKYRTEKLLARRATQNIGPEEAQKLFKDLGLL
ncbi:hypothetical protein CONPUDRAFT_82138 [Coniophora puteana RWD-64-598 SS2]|uniref:Septin-type G domain-containing protein n=1 Tax=Coniophora puteana (strain RWD-64-598) TaxID=741705 RepID=A0A5M3MPF1_CONPW|nr:uncharacterized protein CONPUDRAFT_82138 [Coniophora puteana RWD-64-598 SS2]EIW81062.1 hypothetical protein CONPUDRAFT_82138 [Coniophora puteana RWD-64-598 SS2]